jgi:cobalamin biosynthesis protein CobD/CbiB
MHERRVLLRARAFMGMLAICCAVGSAMAVEYLVEYLLEGINIRQKWTFLAMDLAAAAVLFGAAFTLARHARKVHLLLKKAREAQAAGSPDFTPLSDGSQRVENLKKLK